jgi:hypothetical protein
MDIEVGDRCVSDWVLRALLASVAVILVGIVWRSLSTRGDRRAWEREREADERRGAALGDMGPVAIKDPAAAARQLLRALGTGAGEYARRERRRAFAAGDIATAGKWQDVERAIERMG